MLCSVYVVSLSENGSAIERCLSECVDLDYFSIAQWRSILFQLEKANKVQLSKLEFRPQIHDQTF